MFMYLFYKKPSVFVVRIQMHMEIGKENPFVNVRIASFPMFVADTSLRWILKINLPH